MKKSRRSQTRPSQPQPGRPTDTVEGHVPSGLRSRLEAARLELLALMRALDSLMLFQQIPDELHTLMELDADFAEALAVLDHPRGRYDLASMVIDTLASLADLALTREHLLDTLSEADRQRLDKRIPAVRATLHPIEAYNQIPGRDPHLR